MLPLCHRGPQYKVYKNGILDQWYKDFSSLYNLSSVKTYEHTKFADNIVEELFETEQNVDTNEELNKPISIVEVCMAIAKAKNKKAAGLDKIPNEVIKNEKLIRVLHKLFNCCFSNNAVPNLWQKAIINPIPKGSDKDPYVPLNYRGISLLSCIGKIYTSILNHRLNDYLENNKLIVEEQNGFRKHRSCDDHIFTLATIINNRNLIGKNTFCAFIDMSKAFDRVNRNLLFHKLLKKKRNGKLYFAIKALYTNTLSAVRINNELTNWFVTDSGVRQCDNLPQSCLIFTCTSMIWQKNLII